MLCAWNLQQPLVIACDSDSGEWHWGAHELSSETATTTLAGAVCQMCSSLLWVVLQKIHIFIFVWIWDHWKLVLGSLAAPLVVPPSECKKTTGMGDGWVHQNRTFPCGCGGYFHGAPVKSRNFLGPIASEQRFPLRWRRTKLIPIARIAMHDFGALRGVVCKATFSLHNVYVLCPDKTRQRWRELSPTTPQDTKSTLCACFLRKRRFVNGGFSMWLAGKSTKEQSSVEV